MTDGAPRARLTVVGTGIKAVGQLTVESIAAIRAADVLFHLTTDVAADAVLDAMKPGAASLRDCYVAGRDRGEAYDAMATRILAALTSGARVCAAFYGHPGVYAFAPHEAVRRARLAGFEATMLPGVSAEDCLVADLGLDPGDHGCVSYEATDFLLYDRAADPAGLLLLWQVAALGQWTHEQRFDPWAIALLVEKLAALHPRDHEVTAYAAAMFPGEAPEVHRVPLRSLDAVDWRPRHTLVVPPSASRRPDEATAAAFRRMREARTTPA